MDAEGVDDIEGLTAGGGSPPFIEDVVVVVIEGVCMSDERR